MRAHILVIEDNPPNLELMTYLLRAFGYTPLVARDGEEGLEAALQERPDLIICDVQLPQMDGYEVIRRLKADANWRRVPVVAVTAMAMVGDRDKVMSAGFDGYIPKPITPEAFVEQVEAFLSRELLADRPVVDATSNAEATPVEKRATILVLDNLASNLELARSILEPSGYEVYAVLSATEALAVARTVRPDLILSDLRMPGCDGYEFLEAVQADPELRAIPVIIITSTYGTERHRARALALGAVAYLVRPVEPQVVLAEIESCLKARA